MEKCRSEELQDENESSLLNLIQWQFLQTTNTIKNLVGGFLGSASNLNYCIE